MYQLGRESNSGGEKRECLICLRFLPSRKPDGENFDKNEENFTKILDILKVNLTPFNFNFHIEGFPFCLNCSKWVHDLIELQHRLEEMQNQINKRIWDIRTKLKESEETKTSAPGDVRAIIFRGQIIKNTPHPPEPAKIDTVVLMAEGSTVPESSGHIIIGPGIAFTSLSPSKSTRHVRRSAGYDQLCQQGGYSLPVSLPSRPVTTISNQHLVVTHEEFQNILVQVVDKVPEPETIVSELNHNDNDVAANETVYEDDDYNGDDYHNSGGVGDNESDFVPEDDSDEDSEVKYRINSVTTRNLNKEKTSKKLKLSSSKKQLKSPLKRKSKSSSTTRRPRKSGTKKATSRYATTRLNKGVRTPIITDGNGREFLESIELKPIPKGYECGECGETFFQNSLTHSSKFYLKEHIRGVHLGLYKCLQCGESFDRSTRLSLHTRREHVLGKVECEICKKPLAPKSMDWHLFLHMNTFEQNQAEAAGLKPRSSHTKQMCGICGKLFCSIDVMKAHERTHDIDRLTVPCPHCDGKYTTNKQLRIHIERMHGDGPMEKKFACLNCGLKCRTRSILKEHMLTHLKKQELPHECSICGKRVATKKAARNHEQRFHKDGDSADKFIYPCEVCGQRFRTKKSVPDHMRYHPEERRAKINQRKSVLVIVPDLQREKEQNEENENPNGDRNSTNIPKLDAADDGQLSFRNINVTIIDGGYQCGRCERKIKVKFNQVRAIVEHINAYHYGSYQCPICQKYNASAKSLKNHVSCHNNKVSCEICGRPGLNPRNLESHRWTHHNSEVEKQIIATGQFWKLPFDARKRLGIKGVQRWHCKNCDEILQSSSALAGHRKKHHPSSNNNRKRKCDSVSRGKPCPKSNKLKQEHIYSDSESEEDDESLNFSDFSGSENEDFGISPERPEPSTSNTSKSISRTIRYGNNQMVTGSNPELRRSSRISSFVPLIRLPDPVYRGQDIKIENDSFLSYSTCTGKSGKISLQDLDVSNKKSHFEILDSGSSDEED